MNIFQQILRFIEKMRLWCWGVHNIITVMMKI